MTKSTTGRRQPCKLNITPRAVEELQSIHRAHSSDPSHVMRIDAESQGFSLWIGPEIAGDVVLGSGETYELRISSEQARQMAGEILIIDFWETSPMGPSLIIYREEEPPPHLTAPKSRTTSTASSRRKKGSSVPGARQRPAKAKGEAAAVSGGRKKTLPQKAKTTPAPSPKKVTR